MGLLNCKGLKMKTAKQLEEMKIELSKKINSCQNAMNSVYCGDDEYNRNYIAKIQYMAQYNILLEILNG